MTSQPERSDLKVVAKSQVPEIMKGSTADRIHSLTQPFRETVERFLKQLERQSIAPELIPAFPFIVVGKRTVQCLMESLTNQLGKDRFEEIASEAGFATGIAFGDTLISHLREQNCLPRDVEALVAIWAPYDRAANWGTFVLQESEQDKLLIRLNDNFLEEGRTGKRHRYCAFIRGYIEGFLWEVLKEHHRWFTEAVTKPAYGPLEPMAVKEVPKNDECLFEVVLKKEQLESAFDYYIKGKKALRAKQLLDAGLAMRTAMEIALKLKIGITETDRVSFFKLIKSYKANAVLANQQVFAAASDAYDLISRTIAHGEGQVSAEEISNMVPAVARVLRKLELADIGKDRAEAIRKGLGGVD